VPSEEEAIDSIKIDLEKYTPCNVIPVGSGDVIEAEPRT